MNEKVSNNQFKNIIESSFDAAVLFDVEGKITYASSAVTRILGYEVNELIGMSYDKFLVTHKSAETSDMFQSVLDGTPLVFLTLHVKKKDGTACIIEGNATAAHSAHNKERISGVQFIFRDVTERKANEYLLKNEQLKLEFLARRIIDLQEDERTRLAFTLHDQIGQPLNIIKLFVNKACNTDNDIKVCREALRKSMSILDELIELINTLSLDLRPKLLDDLGLIKALKWYFDRFKKLFGIDVIFDFYDDASLPIEVVNTVYRVIQEAMNNVVRHANASVVKVSVRVEKCVLHLSVEDDGIGFDISSLTPENAVGINIMMERFKLIGGDLNVSSKPGDGTIITGSIPYNV